MTDMEETPDAAGNLDAILESYAVDNYEKAQHSEDPKKYLLDAIHDVVGEFKVPHAIQHNVLNFIVDRYIFYRRHQERALEDAKRETLIDTYEYLLRLHNDLPIIVNPPMKDDWRHP